MRNSALHAILADFTADAAARLAAEADAGAEVPFELVAERGGSAPLYCYRPLTGRFIADHLAQLRGLTSYAPAARALADLEGTALYLRRHAEPGIAGEPRERADAALRLFLATNFAERTRFGFDPDRFEAAYAELELTLYEGRHTTTVLAPMLGLALDHGTSELVLGDGLSLVRGDRLPEAPHEAVQGEGEEAGVLAVLTATEDPDRPSPVSDARRRFRRLLTALRLFERGSYALGPLGWARTDGGAWRPLALPSGGRPRSVTFLSAEYEDELRAFHNLLARRLPAGGEIGWALGRFEMGCERSSPLQALSDHLLALRALLEPEGPASGRLAGRLAAVCGQPEERLALTERMVRAVGLERAVISGLGSPEPDAAALVSELAEHLRAILRDVLCGHLDTEVCSLADELLAEAALAG